MVEKRRAVHAGLSRSKRPASDRKPARRDRQRAPSSVAATSPGSACGAR
jgi:hypothetical protein